MSLNKNAKLLLLSGQARTLPLTMSAVNRNWQTEAEAVDITDHVRSKPREPIVGDIQYSIVNLDVERSPQEWPNEN